MDGFYKYFKKNISLYIFLIPGIIICILFRYIPLGYLAIAFENYSYSKGIFGSKWVGLEHIIGFFNDPYFFRLLKNTFVLGFYWLFIGFPICLLFALLINEIKSSAYKRIVQSVSFIPYFISVVIVVGLMKELFSPGGGVVNQMIALFGGEKKDFFIEPGWFRFLFISSRLWQEMGFSAIYILAAVVTINPELYESAYMDGASRFRQAVHITLPCISPVVGTLFLISAGQIMSGGELQKIILMYNPLTYETADVVSTYMFRQGLEGGSISFATAVGLFQAVISLVLLTITNSISKRVSDISVW